MNCEVKKYSAKFQKIILTRFCKIVIFSTVGSNTIDRNFSHNYACSVVHRMGGHAVEV